MSQIGYFINVFKYSDALIISSDIIPTILIFLNQNLFKKVIFLKRNKEFLKYFLIIFMRKITKFNNKFLQSLSYVCMKLLQKVFERFTAY